MNSSGLDLDEHTLVSFPPQTRAWVAQEGGSSIGKGWIPGMQVGDSFMTSGSIVTDWMHVGPAHWGTPAIAFAIVQDPSQGIGASKEVVIPPRLQGSVLAVNLVGNEHEPFGSSQVQGAHPGPTKSSYRSGI